MNKNISVLFCTVDAGGDSQNKRRSQVQKYSWYVMCCKKGCCLPEEILSLLADIRGSRILERLSLKTPHLCIITPNTTPEFSRLWKVAQFATGPSCCSLNCQDQEITQICLPFKQVCYTFGLRSVVCILRLKRNSFVEHLRVRQIDTIRSTVYDNTARYLFILCN